MDVSYGFLSVLPLILMIVLAVITKKVLEPVILCTLLAFIISDKTNFFFAWASALESEVSNFAYFTLVFASIGALIRLLMKSNSVIGFSRLLSKFIKSRRSALMATWLAGILVFADDFINSLGVGTSMRTLTDKYHVSREFLAYTINSTGAIVCILVPMSTWGAFLTSQFEKYPVTGSALSDYLHAIPYMFYCWAALLLVPLFIFRIVPLFGKMKQAELRTAGGQVFPDGCTQPAQETAEEDSVGHALDFIIPMLLFVVLGIYWGSIPNAIFVAIFSCAVLYLPRKIMTFGEFMDSIVEGVKDMVSVMMLLVFVFLLGTCCSNMGATEYITSVLSPIMIPAILPFATFLGVSLLAIGTGSFWGSAAIALPVFLELGAAAGANPYHIFGAAASAIALASHISFWNDAVTVTCSACEIRNSDYAQTTTPLLIIPFAVACIGYLIIGFMH